MASIQKYRGKRATTYRVMWRLTTGEQRSQTFKSYGDARDAQRRLAELERRGKVPDPRKGRLSLEEWSEAFMSTLHVKPKTEESYRSLLRSRILPYLGARRLSALTRLEVQQWVSALSNEVSPRRTHAAYALLSQMLTEAVRHDLLVTNPAEGIATPKAAKRAVDPLTYPQLEELASHCGRYRPFILWLGIMGTRWAETVGLTQEAFNGGSVTIDSSLSEVNGKFHRVTTKTGNCRTLPVPENLMRMLPEAKPGLIFSTTYGNPIRSAKFRADVWKPACNKVGIEGVRLHDLRHTCASQLISNGASVKLVQTWLGHADIKVTLDIYGHLYPNELTGISKLIEENMLASDLR